MKVFSAQVWFVSFATVYSPSINRGISKTRNGMEQKNGTSGTPRKFTHHRVTTNFCVPTVCRTHAVPYKLQRSEGSQVCRKSSVRQHRCTDIAKHVCQLTLLNCSLATYFAAGVHSKLQLLKVSLKLFFCSVSLRTR